MACQSRHGWPITRVLPEIRFPLSPLMLQGFGRDLFFFFSFSFSYSFSHILCFSFLFPSLRSKLYARLIVELMGIPSSPSSSSSSSSSSLSLLLSFPRGKFPNVEANGPPFLSFTLNSRTTGLATARIILSVTTVQELVTTII
ncbi:hypothetical protein SODALDRAFT_161050 [Sodiomyces alkalinus F11]|uniref:Uncharacterized protein n=1 Tax=Sodiomyces alkalinus (strain CBS 110278 / VKM F-3762 / F11) TaxID=1314773 RepID=A0A3N2PV44_SODAK|nr:hypothetical protein SODALDRAFT_161050 [Sodiomyces alkalinus F11]ROT38377.1 hypothetical protein SODALDRAFT_161050 [Sodiomyces alkalinus F11]